ncbi:MAG: DUF1080 domain-containing protein [Gemmatimonadota bacterium]|nr:DUF1080 domain-containing protein [Gemmatimonadota bacterium]
MIRSIEDAADRPYPRVRVSAVISLTGALAVCACAPAGEMDGGADPAGEAEAASTPPATRSSGERTPNTLTLEELGEGWRLLFDGRSTDGWRAYNGEAFPDTGWAVVDGMLVVGATATDPDVPIGGDIVTDEEFGDFDLRFDFRLSPVANSGVLYRVIEQPGAEIWHNAPEYQVLDDQAYIEMGTMDMNTHLTGDNYDLHASGEKVLRPVGEWNEGRIVVRGNHVEHWLNGRMTVEYDLLSPAWEELVAASKFAPYPEYGRAPRGPIGLQDHGRLVWYRNIRINTEPEALADASGTIELFDGESLDGWRVHGTERWYVEDGELVCESGPDEQYGYLVTEMTFTDFDLRLQFRQEADGNSGVFFRSSVDGTTVSGWQAEVAPPGLWTGGIYESYGRGWLIQPDSTRRDVVMGEWNDMRIRAVGDTVTTWLNGVEMVTLVDEEIGRAEGSIALQIHDGGGIRVRWRDVVIEDLSSR